MTATYTPFVPATDRGNKMKIEATLIQSGDNGDNLITEIVINDGAVEKSFFTHNANSYREGPFASPDDAGYDAETLADIMSDDPVIDGDIYVDGVQCPPNDEQTTAIFAAL